MGAGWGQEAENRPVRHGTARNCEPIVSCGYSEARNRPERRGTVRSFLENNCVGRPTPRVRIPGPPLGGLHVSVRIIVTFGSDVPASWWSMAWCGVLGALRRGLVSWLSCFRAGFRLAVAAVVVVTVAGLAVGGGCGSGRPCGEAGEGLAAPAAGFRGQPGGCAALVFFLPGVPGV